MYRDVGYIFRGRGTLANDAFQNEPGLGYVIDSGRVMIGGLPTDAPDVTSTGLIFSSVLAELVCFRASRA
ncbi:MAG: hypothetical protein SFV32_10475 [Opitutaceae bacterium]|nr:hypothetical protein [Opitutaceae bacterium]